MDIHVVVDRSAERLGIYLSYAECSDVEVFSRDSLLNLELRRAVGELTTSLSLENLRNHPIVRAYRDIMWRLGIDPTKVRPSSEALARRVLSGKPLPSINNVVDACNIASLKTLVPISVFDLSRATPPLILRKSLRGELFIDISGREVRLSGKEIVLSDSKGRVLHVYPHRDSAHASISSGTKEVLVVAYGAPGVPKYLVRDAVEITLRLIRVSIPKAVCSEARRAGYTGSP